MEVAAIHGYYESIKLAFELGDNGTRELLDSILKEEEAHIDLIEVQLDQIKQWEFRTIWLSRLTDRIRKFKENGFPQRAIFFEQRCRSGLLARSRVVLQSFDVL